LCRLGRSHEVSKNGHCQIRTSGLVCATASAETEHLARDAFAIWAVPDGTTLTVIVVGVWAVTSDAIGIARVVRIGAGTHAATFVRLRKRSSPGSPPTSWLLRTNSSHVGGGRIVAPLRLKRKRAAR
jgi:hypothetical protein